MLSSRDEAVQTLTSLGLTSCQARVYLALVQSGISTAKTISKVSNVARQDTYRITAGLQKLGLVEKTITKPVMFRAVPIKDGLSILLEKRSGETLELQKKTRELINILKERVKPAFQQEEVQFALISGREALINEAKKAIEKAQTSIELVTSSKMFFPWVISQEKLYKEAVERGVKIRLIIDKPEDNQKLPDILQTLKKDSSFRIKYVPTLPLSRMGVYDRKDVYINTSTVAVFKAAPVLWTNNPNLLTALQDFFEILWLTAMEN